MFSSLGLVALTLASAVLADDLAVSVSTADFKARFVQSGIVPEVIAALDPSVSFYASYRAADGHSELLVPGSSLTVAEAGGAPLEFSVENLSNATSVNSQTRFLIYLVTPLLLSVKERTTLTPHPPARRRRPRPQRPQRAQPAPLSRRQLHPLKRHVGRAPDGTAPHRYAADLLPLHALHRAEPGPQHGRAPLHLRAVHAAAQL